jgi:hypothetical protein
MKGTIELLYYRTERITDNESCFDSVALLRNPSPPRRHQEDRRDISGFYSSWLLGYFTHISITTPIASLEKLLYII